MAKKTRKVRLPMAVWQELAHQVSEEAFCRVLTVLRTDSRTRSALLAYVLKMWHRDQVSFKEKFGRAYSVYLGGWGDFAFALIAQGGSFDRTLVQDLRDILIRSCEVIRLLEFNALFRLTVSEAELKSLAKTLATSDNKYDWEQWSELKAMAKRSGSAELQQFVEDQEVETRTNSLGYDG